MRDNTTDLRTQLEEAQRTLALRKEYDELAEKITSNRLLRPREDQHANLEKLNAEIAELERESQEYAQTWAERRQQFGRIIEEGMQLRRLIRDEKEEVERREGMEEREDGEEADAGRAGSGPETPRQGTPMHVGQDAEMLGVEKPSRSVSKSPLRELQNVNGEGEKSSQEVEDEEMAEDGEVEPEGDGDGVAAPGDGEEEAEAGGGMDIS